MLALKTLRTWTRVEPQDLKQALLGLSNEQWRPAVTESMRTLARMADIPEHDVSKLSLISGSGQHQYGDIVFSDGCLYYVLSSLEEEQSFLEVGAIRAEEGTEPRLDEFATAIADAVTSSLDGRKTRHMHFDWSEVSQSSDRLDKIVATEREGEGIDLEKAVLDPLDVAGATVLENEHNRAILVEISQAGFVREQDILSRRGKAKEEAKASLDRLKGGGLIAVENLLECRKTGNPITRLSSKEKLNEPAMSDLTCAACNRAFNKEALTEGYSVSELGKRLIRKSHWMTVAVTNRLADIGVPTESILWNVSESGEEVDLIVEVLGDLWIFELKDREFGAGDAHPFNYRQVRYKAARSVVVTTDKVSTDAKRVFKELAKEGRGSKGPTYIEGLENAEELLRAEIDESYKRHAARQLVEVSIACGFDLRTLVKPYVGDIEFGSNELDEMTFFMQRSLMRTRRRVFA